jgi:hypothetical protein
MNQLDRRLAAAERSPNETTIILNGDTSFTIPVYADDRLIELRWGMLSTGINTLAIRPNSLSTSIYSHAVDVFKNAQGVGASGNGLSYNQNNGLYLASNGTGSSAGDSWWVGEATITLLPRPMAVAHNAVSSSTGSGNQTIETQRFAAFANTTATITSLFGFCTGSGGAMTGTLRVIRHQ